MNRLLALLLVSAALLAQSPTGAITGTIQSPDGKSLEWMRVSVIQATGDGKAGNPDALPNVVRITTTDQTGRYRFEGLPPGRYYLAAGPLADLVYYPGVSSGDQAVAVTVTAGAVLDRIDVSRPPLTVGLEMRLNAAQGAQELWKLRDQFKPVETPIWNSVDEMHRHIVTKFVATPGMGSGRLGPMLMEIDAEKQLLITRTGAAGGKSFAMTKLELIGIARHEQPVAFERIAHGSDRWITRELGEFETSALAELNAGKNTVTRENSGGMFVVGAIRADAACVSCHRTYKEGSLLGAFSYALSPSQAPAPQQRVDALLSRVGSGNPLQSAELDELRSLLADPEASKAITLDQVLATFQRAQANDAVAQISGIGLHWQLSKRWPNDPKIVAFYHEALTVRGPAAIQDLWGTAGTPWDASFIEPVIRTMEDSVRKIPASGRGANGIWLVVDRGLGLLDRHYESWRNDASIPPRLSNVARQVIPIEVNGFYNTTRHLAETRDRAMIAVLRQSLTDKTIDRFTSASSNMPLGVTPMRNCDLAANAILRLLGEPEMVSPFRRAQAPRGGPFPEWDEWDKKIAALQQRLDQLTPR